MTVRFVVAAIAGLLIAFSAHAQLTIRAAMHADLKILDPIWAPSQINRTHGYMVYDTLFGLDDRLMPQPQMVGRWTVDAARLVYTFELRDGLAWHDGAPVTAEDCIASLKRWGSRDGMGQKLLAHVKELSAPDARTIRLELNSPYGLVLEALAKPAGAVPFMMPRRIADTPANQQITEPIGSGPFIFKSDEWRPGEKVVYVRNSKYVPRAEPPRNFAGGKVVRIDQVEWPAIGDPQTAIAALEANEVDAVEAVSHDLLPLVEKKKGIVVERNAYPAQFVLRPNWLQPPFDDPRMRLALGYAIDQKEYLMAAIGDPNFWRVCKAYYGCGTPFASDAGLTWLLDGNVARARELVKEAGYDGRPVVLLTVVDIGMLAKLGAVAKAQLEQIGLKVDLRPADSQTHLSRLIRRETIDNGGWNLTLLSTSVIDVSSPVTSLFLDTSCGKAPPGWPCDAKIEELRDAFARQTDPARQRQIAEEIQVRAAQIGTHYPLGEWFGASAVSASTKGWLRPPSTSVFWNVER